MQWRKMFASRPFLAVSTGEWLVGATGYDSAILGWAMHPIVAATLIGFGAAGLIAHIIVREQAGTLYGKPIVSLGLKAGPPLRKRTPSHTVEEERIVESPKIISRGGESFTLEIRYPATASFSGYGWLSGPGVSNLGMFHLHWQGMHHKKKGDIATVKIAELEGSYSKELKVWGCTETGALRVIHKDTLWQGKAYRLPSDEWLTVTVEIRSVALKEGVRRTYHFRLRKELFEVKEDEG